LLTGIGKGNGAELVRVVIQDPSLTIVDSTATHPLDSVSGLMGGGSSFTARWLDSY
jgi:hypothetical protein